MSTAPPAGSTRDPVPPRRRRRALRGGAPGTVVVEVVRLAVVLASTLGALALGEAFAPGEPGEGLRLAVAALGAAFGYLGGGVFGRFAVGQIDAAERRLSSVPAGVLLAAAVGGFAGLALAFGITWPVLLLGGKAITLPIAAIVIAVLAGAGVRLGAARGGDLLRFMGASGRLPTPSRGSGSAYKVVDTSALIDGRLLHVCRSGFVEGTLMVPQAVCFELQGLADSGDEERRRRGRRGLDVLAALQRSAGVALEVVADDVPEVRDVDAKLLAMARERGAALVTVDGNLARVAEVQGVRVLNLHALAEDLRPPVAPGDRLAVTIVRSGREPGQGVGFMEDGTMVVVEGARGDRGRTVDAVVTSILSNPNGRMVFATRAAAPAGDGGAPPGGPLLEDEVGLGGTAGADPP